MLASARKAKVMTSPSTSKGCRPGAQNGALSAAAGGDAISLPLSPLPQRQLVVEQGQHGRREQVLERLDAQERPDDGGVDRLGHPLGSAPGSDAAGDADRR